MSLDPLLLEMERMETQEALKQVRHNQEYLSTTVAKILQTQEIMQQTITNLGQQFKKIIQHQSYTCTCMYGPPLTHSPTVVSPLIHVHTAGVSPCVQNTPVQHQNPRPQLILTKIQCPATNQEQSTLSHLTPPVQPAPLKPTTTSAKYLDSREIRPDEI